MNYAIFFNKNLPDGAKQWNTLFWTDKNPKLGVVQDELIPECHKSYSILNIQITYLGTVQWLWQYGTGKLDTGPAVTFDLRAHGAMCFSEASAHWVTAYFWLAEILILY